jgi:nucleoid-associated protein YgaU
MDHHYYYMRFPYHYRSLNMAAQVKLQWTHVPVAGVTQEVQRKINAEEFQTIFYDASIEANVDVTNGWMVSDSADYTEDTEVTYRVLVNNGIYSLPSNEVVLTINAAPIAINDLSGTIEVV